MDSKPVQRLDPIKLVVKGPEFQDERYPRTYPVFEVSDLVLASADILRNSAPHISEDGVEIGPAYIDIRASFPTESSYAQELFIAVKNLLQDNAVPIVTAYFLSETIKRANDLFAFYEHIRNFRKREKSPEVEHVGDGQVVITGAGNKKFILNEELLRNAPYVVEDYALLLARLGPERFSSVQLKAPDGTELNINYQESKPFHPQELKQIKSDIRRLQSDAKHGGTLYYRAAAALAAPTFDEAKAVSLNGRIRELDLDAKSGRFHAVGNDAVPDGEYPFLLVGAQSAMDVRNLMGEDTLVMFCSPVRRGKKIQRLLVEHVHRALATRSGQES